MRTDTPSQAHLQGTQSRHTKANLAKEPALYQRTARPPRLTNIYHHLFDTSAIYRYWTPKPTHHPTAFINFLPVNTLTASII